MLLLLLSLVVVSSSRHWRPHRMWMKMNSGLVKARLLPVLQFLPAAALVVLQSLEGIMQYLHSVSEFQMLWLLWSALLVTYWLNFMHALKKEDLCGPKFMHAYCILQWAFEFSNITRHGINVSAEYVLPGSLFSGLLFNVLCMCVLWVFLGFTKVQSLSLSPF